MKTLIIEFLKAEDGVAVVDMTMLMAALVSLALAVGSQVSGGLEDLSGDMEDTMVGIQVGPAW